MALSDEARKEIQEAIAIVREDRIFSFMRGSSKPKEPGPDDPPDDPNQPTPPKPKDPPPDKPKKRSAWWGEIHSEDDDKDEGK